MSQLQRVLRTFQDRPLLADLLAVLFGLRFLFVFWQLVHNQVSVLDEGLYLYKGRLFSSGQYSPFQAYGAWTNQMPLAFLIPGWIEQIFGAGLQTGRMLSFVLGILMLSGTWLTARRLGGRWVGAGVMAAIALDPAAARMFAPAASQGLVACLLAWTFWFSLGVDRKTWQVLIAGLLAGTAVMVRINLLPLLPLLTLYILWSSGWKKMLWALAGMLVVFGGVHILYWPNILRLWAKWLPFSFLKAWFPPKTTPTWQPDNPIGFRIASFFLAFRYHFAAMAGSLAAWYFWPTRERVKSDHFKIAVFLSALLVSLILLHAWAALGNEYCVFCFPTYSAFYAGTGLLLVAVTLPNWNLNPPAWRKWLGAAVFLLLIAGMAYSAEGAFETMLGGQFYKRLLSVPFPAYHGALLWQVLANKLQLTYEVLLDGFHTWFPVVGVVSVWLIIFAGFAIFARKKARVLTGLSLTVLLFIFLGSVFSPLPVMAGDYTSYDCPSPVIQGYEAAGTMLNHLIPPGSKIFWAGYSPVTLLYIPGAKIFPAQLHGTYSFRISTDDDALLNYGWWNDHLAEKWLTEADFILAEQRNLEKNDWLRAAGHLDDFVQVAQTAPQTCQENSALVLFRRK